MTQLTKLVANCQTGEIQEVPLTAEEIAQLEADATQVEQEHLAQKAEAQRIADLKSSAKAKLIAGQPLTEEEASVLVI